MCSFRRQFLFIWPSEGIWQWFTTTALQLPPKSQRDTTARFHQTEKQTGKCRSSILYLSIPSPNSVKQISTNSIAKMPAFPYYQVSRLSPFTWISMLTIVSLDFFYDKLLRELSLTLLNFTTRWQGEKTSDISV